MISLNLRLPAASGKHNAERILLGSILAVLDEINSNDGVDTAVVFERTLPFMADDIRRALKGWTEYPTILQELLQDRDERIAELEGRLAEKAVESDAERTAAENLLRVIRAACDNESPFDAIGIVEQHVDAALLGF